MKLNTTPNQRLLREAKVWSRLRHPNVLMLLGFALDDELKEGWLISPWMDQGNLEEYLVRLAVPGMLEARFVKDDSAAA